MTFCGTLNEWQSQPPTLNANVLHPLERLKEALQLLLWNRYPHIVNRQHHSSIEGANLDGDWTFCIAVFLRIGQQVLKFASSMSYTSTLL